MKAPETHDTEKMRGDPDGREAAAASRPAGSVGSLPLRDAPSPARQEQQEPPGPRTGPRRPQGQDRERSQRPSGAPASQKRRAGRQEGTGSLPHLADELQGCPAGALSASTAEATGSIPGQETKIPQALRQGQKNKQPACVTAQGNSMPYPVMNRNGKEC